MAAYLIFEEAYFEGELANPNERNTYGFYDD